MSTFTISHANRIPAMNRNATIVISVIALHVAVLWAMQTGLLRRMAEAVVPAEILVEIMSPSAPLPSAQPTPQPAPRPKAAQKSVQPKPVQPAPAPTAAIQPAPSPLALAPSATAPDTSATAPTALAAAPAATPANTGSKANVAPTPPAPPKVELPSSSADYLNNPKPAYPKRSWQLHEQGKVVVRVWIGTDGTASQASVKTSSGFDRLDQAAVTTVLAWRYVPGKRGGVAEAMWFDVPVNWVLQ
jgi:protein TonB